MRVIIVESETVDYKRGYRWWAVDVHQKKCYNFKDIDGTWQVVPPVHMHISERKKQL